MAAGDVAQAQMHCFLAPHIAAAARAWAGPESAVQYGKARGQGMTWMRVRWMHGALERGVRLDA